MMPAGRPYLSVLTMVLGAATTAVAADLDSAAHGSRYVVTEIVTPLPPDCEASFQTITYGRRLNERAQTAGYFVCFVPTGDPVATHDFSTRAFTWTRSGGVNFLPAVSVDATDTYARDINERGTAVGWEISADGFRAPVWPASGGAAYAAEAVACGPGEFLRTRAEGINDLGAIALTDRRNDGNGCEQRWMLKLADGREFLGPHGSPRHINNRNVMIGDGGSNQVVRWSPATGAVVLATEVPMQSFPFAWSINDRNEGVGQIAHTDEVTGCTVRTEAAFWTAGGRQRVLTGLPGAPHSIAFGINGRSDVVGYAQFDSPCETADPLQSRALLWRDGRVRDLNTLLPRNLAREVQLFHASAINDRGQILARGVRPAEPRKPCPIWTFDPATGEPYYDASLTCRSEYTFLLTPR